MNCAEKKGMTVEARIAEAAEFARPICEKLRAAIRHGAPQLREVIKWGNPCYEGGGLVCGFAAFQKHVRLFFFKGAQVPDPDGLLAQGEDNVSGRALSFTSAEAVPVKKVERLVRAAAKLDADKSRKPLPRARRPELPMPKEFSIALKRTPKARAFFEILPPSCRREYIEWISTAKREETRARRLAEALTMLSSGRRYNDEYRARSVRPTA
jgi:hypothetical protein